MGNLFSSKEVPVVVKSDDSDAQVAELLSKITEIEKIVNNDIADRLQAMEQQADINHDGIVTRDEMENYMTSQLQIREQELIDLRDEYNSLQQKYKLLQDRYQRLQDGILAENPDISKLPMSVISKKQIAKYVDDLMSTDEGNLDIVPDIIERPMQIKKYKMLLETIEHFAKTATLKIAGHEIMIAIHPLS